VSESTNPRSLAIQALILDRCRALGLIRSELVRVLVSKTYQKASGGWTNFAAANFKRPSG
jgi:hypothetical protein